MNLFWLGGTNFGDKLTPVLYRLMTGEEPTIGSAPPRIFCIGSIAQSAQAGDILWGTGALTAEMEINTGVEALAVRGPLTAELLRGERCEVYGDPSLLLSRYHQPLVPINSTPAIVPHYIDKPLVASRSDLALIDIQADPLVIIKQLAGAEWVASSSLHGISVAEAYGVRAVWVEFGDGVAGKGFKFRDYYLGTGRVPPDPVDCRSGMDLRRVYRALDRWEEPVVDPRLLEACPWIGAQQSSTTAG